MPRSAAPLVPPLGARRAFPALLALCFSCASAPEKPAGPRLDPTARETEQVVAAAEADRVEKRFGDRLARLRAAQDRRPVKMFTRSATVAAAELLKRPGVDSRLLAEAATPGAAPIASGSSLRAMKAAPSREATLSAGACWLGIERARAVRRLEYARSTKASKAALGRQALELYELDGLTVRVRAELSAREVCEGCLPCDSPEVSAALAALEARLEGVPPKAAKARLDALLQSEAGLPAAQD